MCAFLKGQDPDKVDAIVHKLHKNLFGIMIVFRVLIIVKL